MTSTIFKKQEQMIFLKSQRKRKRFHPKQTPILINEAWRSRDGGCGVFLSNSKKENNFHKKEQKIFLKALEGKMKFSFKTNNPLKK